MYGAGNLGPWTTLRGIYREEVELILWTLADIHVNVERIISYIEGDDSEEEEDPAEDA